MRITIDLTPEDIRKLIGNKIANECSKHGHPSSMEPRIVIHRQDGTPIGLPDLEIAVHAEVEVS